MSKPITVEDLNLSPEEKAKFLMGSLMLAGTPDEEVPLDEPEAEGKLEYGD